MAVDGGDPLLEPLLAVSARIFIAVDGEPLEPLLAVSAVQPSKPLRPNFTILFTTFSRKKKCQPIIGERDSRLSKLIGYSINK
jgi:hypothetical protein